VSALGAENTTGDGPEIVVHAIAWVRPGTGSVAVATYVRVAPTSTVPGPLAESVTDGHVPAVSQPLLATPSQSLNPLAHWNAQRPASHVPVPLGAAQLLRHAPQLEGSVASAASHPSLAFALQSAVPA